MNCPSCSAASSVIIPAVNLPCRLSILRCSECGLDFMEETVEDDYWSAEGQVEIYDEPEVQRERERFFLGILDTLKRMMGERGRLLDVGAGRGDFARAANDEGWQVSVLEPSREAAKSLCAGYMEVHNRRFEEFTAESRFDCVTMLDVIEHTRNPRAAVIRAADCLRVGGVALFLTPDGGSLLRRAARTLGSLSPRFAGLEKYFYYPPHVSYLCSATLARYAREGGLKPVALKRTSTPKRFLLAKLASHYRKYSGNAAFTAAVATFYPLASAAAANKLIFAARKVAQ